MHYFRVIRTIGRRQDIARTALAVILAFLSTTGLAVETGVFQPPSLEEFTFEKESTFDADEDGIKESTTLIYKNASGDQIYSMTTRGKLWCWGFWLSVEQSIYAIADTDCDGEFDTRYAQNEDIKMPACVKQ